MLAYYLLQIYASKRYLSCKTYLFPTFYEKLNCGGNKFNKLAKSNKFRLMLRRAHVYRIDSNLFLICNLLQRNILQQSLDS